jgi:hypothetical protein
MAQNCFSVYHYPFMLIDPNRDPAVAEFRMARVDTVYD